MQTMNMSVAELKEEAIRQFALKVEAAEDEKVLQVILDFLNNIQPSDKQAISLSRHYDSIKAQYGATLQKLAE